MAASISFPSSNVEITKDGVSTKTVNLFQSKSRNDNVWDGYCFDETYNESGIYQTNLYKSITSTPSSTGNHIVVFYPPGNNDECATGTGNCPAGYTHLVIIGIDKDGKETVIYNNKPLRMQTLYPTLYWTAYKIGNVEIYGAGSDSYTFKQSDYEKYPNFKIGVYTGSNYHTVGSESSANDGLAGEIIRYGDSTAGKYFHCYWHQHFYYVDHLNWYEDTVVGLSNVKAEMYNDPMYTERHYQEQNDGSAKLIDSKKVSVKLGDVVTPEVKNYTGFKAPNTQTVTFNDYVHAKIDYYYKKYKYSISFNLNGGAINSNLPDNVYWDEVISLPNPVREGFEFQGWTITGMDNSDHKYGSLTGSEETAEGRKETSFSNLRVTPGDIVFTAVWKDKTAPTVNIKYEQEDGTPYVLDTYTKQNVIATVTAEDAGSGIYGIKWDDGKYKEGNTNKKIFSLSGSYSGTVTAKDNADTEGFNYDPSKANETTIKYGVVKIDQTPPVGKVTYGYKTNESIYYFSEGNRITNKDVTIKIVATDEHSGLNTNAAYSWNSEDDWGMVTTKTVTSNETGFVLIRDKVGNIAKVEYSVSGIDKKAPIVYPDIKPKPDPNDPNNPYNPDEDDEYTYEKLGEMEYDWFNSDLNIHFKSEDRPDNENGYSSSGIKEMRLYIADEDFNKPSTPTAISNSGSISYIVTKQGITHYIVEAEDAVENITRLNVTVKIDKTAPIISSNSSGNSNMTITSVDLNEYGIDEVESMIKNTEAMKCSFKFGVSDYNNSSYGGYTDTTDSSGIADLTLRLINADDDTDFKDYEFIYYIREKTKNTKEFSINGTSAILETFFVNGIDTFAEFPNASALKYQITIKDRAGNETVYASKAGDEIKNFSIKAALFYAGIKEEDSSSASNSNSEFNIIQNDFNGHETNVPYFRTGDFGYVEVWTIGYVPEICFDFGYVGEESAKEIISNKMDRKYNLGVYSGTENLDYVRKVPVSQATEITTSFSKVNGIPYAAHYGFIEKSIVNSNRSNIYDLFGQRFLEAGTSIRIPIYYQLEKDASSLKEDKRTGYGTEVHSAEILALKGNGSYKDKSEVIYVIWDKGNLDVHYRITHES